MQLLQSLCPKFNFRIKFEKHNNNFLDSQYNQYRNKISALDNATFSFFFSFFLFFHFTQLTLSACLSLFTSHFIGPAVTIPERVRYWTECEPEEVKGKLRNFMGTFSRLCWCKHNNNWNNTMKNWIIFLNIINLKIKITQHYFDTSTLHLSFI